MATGWVKSLQCKSRALDDVVHRHSSCRKSAQNLKDVVETNPKKPSPEKSEHISMTRIRPCTPTRQSRAPDSFRQALAELPVGHPSRNVVEIIFNTSWSPKSFPGRVDMVFRINSLQRTVTRFEEYRETVRTRASSCGDGCEEHARCVADGNEVMRFHCLEPSNGGPCDASGGALAFRSAWKGSAAICTFSESSGAHDSAGVGTRRRAMLLCRVIAGRVHGFDSLLEGRVGFDSVSGDNGELLVFDSRAILPCFLIIYKL